MLRTIAAGLVHWILCEASAAEEIWRAAMLIRRPVMTAAAVHAAAAIAMRWSVATAELAVNAAHAGAEGESVSGLETTSLEQYLILKGIVQRILRGVKNKLK